jgi:hypothetical protein
MSKEVTDLKYPMVDLLTDTTMLIIYLNMLAASNLLFLSFPFMKEWMKGLEGGLMAAPEQKEPRSRNRQIGHMP